MIKKNPIYIFICFILFSILISSCSENIFPVIHNNKDIVPVETIININDTELENIIRMYISKTGGENIYKSDLETITEIQNGDGLVTDLSGMEYCKNITKISLPFCNIDDISSLSFLTKLEVLELHDNTALELNLTPLKELISLKELSLYNSNITNLNSISGLINLNKLNLKKTGITNIEDLSELVNLTHLSLAENSINNIDDISDLIYIEELRLNNNSIINISPLSTLENLSILFINNNSVNNISVLWTLYDDYGILSSVNVLNNDFDPYTSPHFDTISDLWGEGVMVIYFE